MKKFFETIKNIAAYSIAPNKCVFCDKIIGLKGKVCFECEKSLPYVRLDVCPKCGKDDCICIQEKYVFDRMAVPFYYDKPVAESIQRFKFGNCFFYADTYAYFMAKKLAATDFAENIDVITFIPSSKPDKRTRGYNQAQLLAKALSAVCNLPWEELVVKVRKTRKQHELDGKERRKNLKGAFSLSQQANVKGKTVVLCDDIMTTGTTLNEASKVLKKAGAANIICCVVATTYCRNGIFMAEYIK